MMPGFLKDPVQAPLVLLAGTLAVIAGFFWFQYGMDLAPCPLCNWQRIPYYVGGCCFVLAWAFNRQNGTPTRIGKGVLAVAGVGFLVGAGIAVFHVGVEQRWWDGPASCAGGLGDAGSIEEAVERLMAAPVVRCDEVPWSLFGVSMAGYNVLLSLALGLGTLVAAISVKPKGDAA